jgi:DNA-directed RNA polymerase specialized sigma24 family protein
MTTPARRHSKAHPARLRDEAIIDRGGDIPHDSIASDDHLLTTAQSGDQQAFAELCRRHSPLVKKRIFSIVKSQEDTEDALQDTLFRAYMNLGAFHRTAEYYGAESSVEESAKTLDISLAAAKSRLIRGRKTLRWSLENRGVIDTRV